MPTRNKYVHWRELIAADKITKVLQELREVLAKSNRLDEILQQSGRYAALRKSIRLGIVSQEDQTVTENKIRLALLELLTDMESWEQTDPAVGRELGLITVSGSAEQSILGSEVAVGGNMQIGNNTTINQFAQLADPHFLTPKPQKPEIFVGREDQLEELQEMLFTPGADHFLLLVNGEGGIGKTTLASAYFYRYHQEYAHAAWVLGETSIAGALLTLAVGLNLEFGPTEDTGQRLHRLMTRLANLNQPCLLVVDNANDLEDLDANYEILRRCDNFHLLLTSRLREYQRARLVPVDPLETDTAEDLFATHYRPLDEAESQLFNAIYAAVGGNTLVLEILAKNLKRVNTLRERYTLADLLSDLQQKGLLQLVESRAVDTSYGKLRRAKPEEIIGAMYELEDLSAPQLKLLSVFAVLPPDKIPVAHLEVLLDDFAELEEPLLDLAQRGWVEFDKLEKSFRCNEVIQEVTRKKLPNIISLTLPVRRSVGLLLASDIGGNLLIDFSKVNQYLSTIEFVLDFMPLSDWSILTSKNLISLYLVNGDIMSALKINTNQYEKIKKKIESGGTKKDMNSFLATTYSRFGDIHVALGEYEESLNYFIKSYEVIQNMIKKRSKSEKISQQLSISYFKMGQSYFILGRNDDALLCFNKQREEAEELVGKNNSNLTAKNILAISLERIGHVHFHAGHVEASLKYFIKRLEKGQELYDTAPKNTSYINGLSMSYMHLSDVFLRLGNKNKALFYSKKQVKFMKLISTKHPNNVLFKNRVALGYINAGMSYENSRQKIKNFNRAKKILRAIINLSPEYDPIKTNLLFTKSLVKAAIYRRKINRTVRIKTNPTLLKVSQKA